jgi:hypothetical protein
MLIIFSHNFLNLLLTVCRNLLKLRLSIDVAGLR